MNTRKFVTILSVALCLSLPAFAQDEESMSGDKGVKKKAMHEEMQAEMKAMGEKLDKLVIDMNTAATPEKKLDGAIAVINQMVAQHKKMHDKMMHHGDEHHHHDDAGSKAEKK